MSLISSKPGMWDHARRPLLGLAAYYLVVVAVRLGLGAAFPWVGEQLSQVPPDTPTGFDLSPRTEPSTMTSGEAGLAAVLTMAGAFVLALPVVWVYTFARQKRGFQQSLAQTLVILPIVVAAVVILVKHSVALAFSLGGIVGAVAFRHRLEDTKDAVYIFVAIAIGLAVGVHAYSVAFAISVVYNLVVIGLWVTDFARVPAALAPEIATRRLEKAKGALPDRRTGEYLAQLDQQLLQSMTPDQLKALADRALERKQEYSQSFFDVVEPRDVTLVATVATTAAAAGLRATMEGVLDRQAKDWRLEAGNPLGNGGMELRYKVRCRKRVPSSMLLEAVRTAVAGITDDVVIR